MISIIIIILFNFFIIKEFRKKKILVEKNNEIYIKKKQIDKLKFYNIPLRMILLNIILFGVYFGACYGINTYLLKDFDKNIEIGVLKFIEISKEEIVPDSDDESIYVYGYKTEEESNDIEEYRAYYYALKDGSTISKNLNNAIALKLEKGKHSQIQRRIVYNPFLRVFFIQLYSYQYKIVECDESLCDITIIGDMEETN